MHFLNTQHLAPKEFGSTGLRSFLSISAPFRSQTHPFRLFFLHCFHVLRACLWDKLWSKNTPHKRQSPCVRSFFIVRMLTLNRDFVKAFEDYINVNGCDAVDKEKVSCIQNGHYGYIDIVLFFCYNCNKKAYEYLNGWTENRIV